MNALEKIGARAAGAAADRLAAAIGDEVQGVIVTRTPEGVAITGRNLRGRLFEEPALRWPGGLVR